MQTSPLPFLMARKGVPPQLNCAPTDTKTATNHSSNLSRTLKNDTLEIHSPCFSGEKTYVELRQTYRGKALYGQFDDGKATGNVGYFLTKDKREFIQIITNSVARIDGIIPKRTN